MSDDLSNIEHLIHAFYKVISGFASELRDWDRMRSLFIPGARLFPNSAVGNNSQPSAIDIDSYSQRLAAFLSQHDFFETGFIHQIEVFGNIASVISL